MTRILFPPDSDVIKDHFSRLNQEDQRLSFAQTISRFAIACYVDAIDWKATRLLGAYAGGSMIGLAEASTDGKSTALHAIFTRSAHFARNTINAPSNGSWPRLEAASAARLWAPRRKSTGRVASMIRTPDGIVIMKRQL
jgi:hypothetical protein